MSRMAIGLGSMGMSWPYGPPKDKREMTSLLHPTVEGGVSVKALFLWTFVAVVTPTGMVQAQSMNDKDVTPRS